MVECLVIKNKSFKIVFKNNESQEIDVDYRLYDSIVAEKWFKKINHLKNVPIDNVESGRTDLTNLQKIYEEFCIFADIRPISFKNIDQSLLNSLHEIYEKNHSILSKKQNNSILYKFHHAIHYHERNKKDLTNIDIGWGIKEGPLTEIFNCNDYYENDIKKNNIYLPWSELGKKPWDYWENKEPENQQRINELCKPHITFRAQFFIASKNVIPEISTAFEEWFKKYKEKWIAHHNIKKWDEIDEKSAPLLAVTKYKEDLSSLIFHKFIF